MSTPQPMEISAHFKISLLVVTGLTILSLAIVLAICLFNQNIDKMADLPETQRQLYSTCSFCWQSGFGGILGLIGGKMTS